MPDSIREQIAQAIEIRLKTILVSNGYNINFGLNVNRAKKNFNENRLPAVVLWLGLESVKKQYHNDHRTMIVDIECLDALDLSRSITSDAQINEIIADIQKCLGVYDAAIDALIESIDEVTTEPIYTDDTSNIVSSRITYEIKYMTVKGDPYLQP